MIRAMISMFVKFKVATLDTIKYAIMNDRSTGLVAQ